LIPVHPMRLHRRHISALLRRDFVSAALPHVDRGLVRHGYPWVLTDQGLSYPPTGGPDLPEDPSACPWTLPDLTCGRKDMKTAW
jgi:hypothetical protein